MQDIFAKRSLFSAAPKRLFLFLVLVFISVPVYAGSWEWKGKAGLNYDFISQDYYLRDIDTLGISDDSLAELRSYSDRLDERGVNLRLELQRKGPAKVVFTNNTFLSDEKLRNQINFRIEWGAWKLTSDAEFKSYAGSDDFNIYDSRFQNSSRLGFAFFKNEDWEAEISQEFEYTGYDNRSESVYGYRQHESRVRITRNIADFSALEFALRYDRRDSYDSSLLDFSKGIAEIGLDYIGASRSIQSRIYLERKSYSWDSSDDNYYFFGPYFDASFSVAEQLELSPQLEVQYYDFDVQGLATFSHWRVMTQMELDYRYNLLSTFSIGIARERFQAADSIYNEQDYQATKLLAGYENLSSRKYSFSLDSQLGWRNYLNNDSEFYTDHWFVNLDLLADLNLSDRIRFSVVGGSSFEYHDDKEDDVFLYLLSGNLTYQFK
ncbi:MAG: hypothetical protein IPH59_05410 [bacterium]|nr:hypothetical protein [bacterium]